jgi:hypothetical protein
MIWVSQGSSSHDLRSTIKLALSLALFLVLAAPSLDVATASPQGVQKAARTKNCQCEFDTKDYEAFGTNGACGIAMSNKSRTCEISFAGTGGSAQLIRSILGEAAAQNQLAMAPQIFERYLAYTREGQKDPKPFADANFIEKSLVVLERSAVFRESAMRVKLPIESIDKLFVEFSKKYSERIAKTFAGADEPFTVPEGEDTFSVGEGYVELNFHKIATVRTVYFYAPPR